MVLVIVMLGAFVSAPLSAADLSRYRTFELGSDLATVSKQAGAKESDAKQVHRRPVLIQELQWNPQAGALSSRTASPNDVVFSFYDGSLYRITVKYDRYKTEGLTADDMVEAISATYGVVTQAKRSGRPTQGPYGDEEEILARWEDSDYHFDLIRSSYGGRYSLTGVLKRLEEPVRQALAEAAKLDLSEAPQREIERVAKQDEVERTKLEKARLANKPKFRP